MLADRIRDTAQRLRAASDERDALIREAGRRRDTGDRSWTQEKIAELADITQQAVSRKLKKPQGANPGDTTA